MLETQTKPELIEAIIDGINSWRYDRAQPHSMDESINEALHKQHSIGWDAILEGRPVYTWALVQQEYLDAIQSRRNSRRWLIEISKKFIGVSWDLWTHRNGVEHQELKGEQRQRVFDTTQELLHAYGPRTKRQMELYQDIAKLSQQELQKLPQDYLIRWCQWMK